jgi:hypothetical protein
LHCLSIDNDWCEFIRESEAKTETRYKYDFLSFSKVTKVKVKRKKAKDLEANHDKKLRRREALKNLSKEL